MSWGLLVTVRRAMKNTKNSKRKKRRRLRCVVVTTTAIMMLLQVQLMVHQRATVSIVVSPLSASLEEDKGGWMDAPPVSVRDDKTALTDVRPLPIREDAQPRLEPIAAPSGQGDMNATSLPTAYGQRLHTCQIGNTTHTFAVAPHVIIAGAQKAGTSALSALLSMLPAFQESHKFEAHFFDWLKLKDGTRSAAKKDSKRISVSWPMVKDGSLLTSTEDGPSLTQDDLCRHRHEYATQYFDNDRLLQLTRQQEPVFAFEKTPNYIVRPKVAPLINQICPWKPKILMMLRNPVERLHSYYRMYQRVLRKNHGLYSFEDFVYNAIALLRKKSYTTAPQWNETSWWDNVTTTADSFALTLTPQERDEKSENVRRVYKSSLFVGMYGAQLRRWSQHFGSLVDSDQIKIVRYETFVANQSGVLNEILAFVGAPPHDLSEEVLSQNLSPNSRIQKRRSESYFTPMNPVLREYLRRFYQPYNDELTDLLGEDWRGVWD